MQSYDDPQVMFPLTTLKVLLVHSYPLISTLHIVMLHSDDTFEFKHITTYLFSDFGKSKSVLQTVLKTGTG